ncbi:MAG TPA: hypothetical protein VH164_09950, partial [Ktedonobacteraceae bacterium]|nr:hypothetical protein [Ktedonobacteraceae bacterium]
MEQSERQVAEWVIRQGGYVTVEGRLDPIRKLEELPRGDVRVRGINLVGTLADPSELKRFTGLTGLRELELPGPQWNPGAGSRLDANEEFRALANLTGLEKLTFSLHFLTNINVQDKGLAHLSKLTNMKELRLAQTQVKGTSLAPFTQLRYLDVSYTPFNDEGLANLEKMTQLSKLYLRDTFVTDEGLKHLSDLKKLTELDLYGVRVSDTGLAYLKNLTALRKLNLLGAAVTDSGLDQLAAMTELRELNLYRTQITNAGLERLKAMKHLAALDLRYTRATRAGIDSLRGKLPACRVTFLDSSVERASKPVEGGTLSSWVQSLGGKITLENGRVRKISLSATQVSDTQLKRL